MTQIPQYKPKCTVCKTTENIKDVIVYDEKRNCDAGLWVCKDCIDKIDKKRFIYEKATDTPTS